MRPRSHSVPTGLLFISGLQKEVQEQRRPVRVFIGRDPLFCRHFPVFSLPTKLF